jgi:hypothetical protein
MEIFYIENSERFILYCLCGCFIGIAIILLTIIIILYIEKHQKKNVKNDYELPGNDILAGMSPYIPVYRYNGRTQNGSYHV